jgi:hypothetical protein
MQRQKLHKPLLGNDTVAFSFCTQSLEWLSNVP